MLVPVAVFAPVFAVAACSDNSSEPETTLIIQSTTFDELRSFRAEPKFLEDRALMYPGAPNEVIRVRCEARVNDLVSQLISQLPDAPTKEYVLGEISSTLPLFDLEDSEEQDRALVYLERIMDILGIESSDGLLNTWRYGFDPTDT